MMVLYWVALLLGFALLIFGAEILVRGASALAARLRVADIVIGLTVVAFGTSTPELVVNVIASATNHPDVSFGNVIGSNLVNILLILGIAGLIHPLHTRKNTVWREIPFMVFSVFVLMILCFDRWLNDQSTNVLTRGDGLILLLFFLVFMTYTFGIARVDVQDRPEIPLLGPWQIIVYIIGGLLLLTGGGKLAVEMAVRIAYSLGISERFIALTIVAAGTSLPELATSAVASYRREQDIAIGNVIGSNIFNIFFILGISAVVSPLPFSADFIGDLFFLLIISLILFLTMFTGKRRVLDRWEAAIFLILYAGYVLLPLLGF